MDGLPVSPPREGHTQSKAPLALPLVGRARLRMASSPRRMEGGRTAPRGRQLQASASDPSPARPPLAPGPAEPEWTSSLLQVLPPRDPPAVPGRAPPVCASLQGVVAKKSELLAVLQGPATLLSRGSLVLARMSL